MAISHIGSITGHVINFFKTKLSFLASKLRLLFSKPQAATTHVDEINTSQDEASSIEGMTAFCSPKINEVSEQIKYKNEIYRSRFDIYVNLCQHNARRRRSRAVSRIPTTQVKRVLLKSKKVLIKVQKHIRKVVPHSSKLHAYLSRKSSVYHRVNSDFFAISDHKHKSAKKQRLSFNKKHYPPNYCCFTKQQRIYLLFVQTRTPKHKKAVACVYIDEKGSKKFHCSSVQLLWVAHRIITLSGDVEENPGPFTQTNNDKKVLCSESVNTVSLLESRLLEVGRLPVNVLGDGNCFFRAVSCQLYNTPEYHLYIRFLGVQHLLHNPELYIESNYELSWQNYVNNMAREGTWADNIIIQAVANSFNVTINIIESNANFFPVTVVNPVNTSGLTTNIYIGHIQEYHYVSTMQALNSSTLEKRCEEGLIQKSVSSHEDKVEQGKESDFLKQNQSEVANERQNNRKGENMSKADEAEIHKASKRDYMQKEQENLAYRQREKRMRLAGL